MGHVSPPFLFVAPSSPALTGQVSGRRKYQYDAANPVGNTIAAMAAHERTPSSRIIQPEARTSAVSDRKKVG